MWFAVLVATCCGRIVGGVVYVVTRQVLNLAYDILDQSLPGLRLAADRAFEEFLSLEEASHLLSKRLSTRVHKRSCEAWALLGRVDHMCSRACRAALAPVRVASLDGGAKPARALATVDPARQLVKDIKAKAKYS